MATFTKIGNKWRALIRIKGRQPFSKYCDTKLEAKDWAYKTEKQIREGRPVDLGEDITVEQLIDRYRKMRDKSRPIADTANEHYQLKCLVRCLGSLAAAKVTVEDLVGFAQRRQDEGANPYTINMDVSKLGTVYRYGGIGLNLPDIVHQARPLLNHLGLIGGGGKRERRPTSDELDRLLKAAPEWLAEVIVFAIATAMRRGEIVKIRWLDVDEQRRMVRVRDRKDPRRKKGNDMDIPLFPRAWDVLEKRRGPPDALLFPYHETTVTKAFTQLCRQLSIPDLHFHDLRHEGTSQLFEQGFAIQQVALVTGHKDWRNLRRYTNLKPESLHALGTHRDK